MQRNRTTQLTILFLFGYLVLQAQSAGSGSSSQIYDSNPQPFERLARKPVERLKGYLEKKQFHIIEKEFRDKITFEKFANKFEMLTPDGLIHAGCLRKELLKHRIISETRLSPLNNPPFEIVLRMEKEIPAAYMLAKFTTEHDPLSNRYLISDVKFEEPLPLLNLDCTEDGAAPGGGVSDPLRSVCAQNGSFRYVKLRSRKDATAAIKPAQIMEHRAPPSLNFIDDDDTDLTLFRQIPFNEYQFSINDPLFNSNQITIPNPLYVFCRVLFPANFCSFLGISPFINIWEILPISSAVKYNPGYVLSIQDCINTKSSNPFFRVTDADGVLEVSGTEYPTGFFVDNARKALTILGAGNEVIRYGTDSVPFVQPIAVTVSGQFAYVLDRGFVNAVDVEPGAILVFKFSLQGGELKTHYLGTITSIIGETIRHEPASTGFDITSFEGPDEIVLYLSQDQHPFIKEFILSKSTGMKMANTVEIPKYLNTSTGEFRDIAPLTRLETNLRSSASGRNTIVGISGDKVFSFSHNALNNQNFMTLNFENRLPVGSAPANIGYNMGQNAFYVTDLIKRKIHVFSNEGDYIGSGGKPGTGEVDNELHYPDAISSNIFTSATDEMVVCNRWSPATGFKRIMPLPDIGRLCVIEKAPVDEGNAALDELSFLYGLTSGKGVHTVELKLNGTVIETLSSSNEDVFEADVYARNHRAGSAVIKPLLQPGWNEYTINMDATIEAYGFTFDINKTKTMQFYYLPTEIDEDFVIGNTAGDDLVHDKGGIDDLVIYKNIFVPAGNNKADFTFTLRNGTTRFLYGSVLKVNKPAKFIAENEDFEMLCGANLHLVMGNGNEKTVSGCRFDGLRQCENMVLCSGDFTFDTAPVNSNLSNPKTGSGVPHSNNGQSSKLNFLSCDFENYTGRALHLWEGWGIIADCEFNGQNTVAKRTAILSSPGTRLDVYSGRFLNNDIGLDIVSAELFTGTSKKSYKGISIDNTVFENNKIGIHTFAANAHISNTDFDINDAAVMHLSGSLILNGTKSRHNSFSTNGNAIIFADDLQLKNGYNIFIDNANDLTFLMPFPSYKISYNYNVECNYWSYSGVDDKGPSVDVKSIISGAPVLGTVIFDYVPFLERSNTNSYNCTGGIIGIVPDDFGGGTSANKMATGGHYYDNEEPVSNRMKFPKSYETIAQFERSEERYDGMLALMEDKSMNLQLGRYTKRDDTIASYLESLAKNATFAQISDLLKASADKDTAMISRLLAFKQYSNHGGSKGYYEYMVEDRLAFLEFFKNKGSYQKSSENDGMTTKNRANSSLKMLPNPVHGNARLEIEVTQAGMYSIEIYTITGQVMDQVSRTVQLSNGFNTIPISTEHLENGIYFGRIRFKPNSAIFEREWKFVSISR